jgi:ubiquinone/menaquinone biosynthesis C-methylase UbiE
MIRRLDEYYNNFGHWSIDTYVQERILKDPAVMDRFHRTIEIIPSCVSTLLDVGCGPGVFLNLVEQCLKISGVGIEITDAKIYYAQKKLHLTVLKGDVSSMAFKNQSFDVVTALEVIEHLPYQIYERALWEIQRVAGRWIVVSVPYRERRMSIRCPYCEAEFNPNYHMRAFDETGLREVFKDFMMKKILKVGISRHAPQTVVNVARRWAREVFPEFAICPACGYRQSAETEPNQVIGKRHMLALFANRALHRLVGRNGPSHAIAIYERRD